MVSHTRSCAYSALRDKIGFLKECRDLGEKQIRIREGESE